MSRLSFYESEACNPLVLVGILPNLLLTMLQCLLSLEQRVMHPSLLELMKPDCSWRLVLLELSQPPYKKPYPTLGMA